MKIFTHSRLATISGLIVAVASGWITIDWTDFDIKKEWPKLILSGIIAISGYLSKFKEKTKKEPKKQLLTDNDNTYFPDRDF